MSRFKKTGAIVNIVSRIPGVDWDKLTMEELRTVWEHVRDLPVVGEEARDREVERREWLQKLKAGDRVTVLRGGQRSSTIVASANKLYIYVKSGQCFRRSDGTVYISEFAGGDFYGARIEP